MPEFVLEEIKVADLKPHPRNYNHHPADQLDHLVQSILEHGLYRNVVIANDGTILAGHGVVEAIKKLGWETVPVTRLPIGPDDPTALKVLTGDNEISHLSDKDDRLLTEILKQIKETDVAGLLGTGYDEKMLANLLFVTRPESEVASFDEAAAWVGMPEYDFAPEPMKVIVSFRGEEDKQAFFKLLGQHCTDKTKSIWYPFREREDISSVKFDG